MFEKYERRESAGFTEDDWVLCIHRLGYLAVLLVVISVLILIAFAFIAVITNLGMIVLRLVVVSMMAATNRFDRSGTFFGGIGIRLIKS
jgi:hypothetical protein